MIQPQRQESAVYEPFRAPSKSVARIRRRNYAGLRRVTGVFVLVGVPLMVYLVLMNKVAEQNFGLTKLTAERSALYDRTQRLDERIARLESRERLAQIAQRLGMRDPQSYAVVVVSPPAPVTVEQQRRVAFLGAIANWLRTQ